MKVVKDAKIVIDKALKTVEENPGDKATLKELKGAKKAYRVNNSIILHKENSGKI